MNPTDVIESYVLDVIRRVPARDRNDIGLELRGLLGEMLAERARADSTATDDAVVLSMLQDFGTPAQIAASYRSPGPVIIPDDQTRSFTLVAIAGVGLQWALTLPRVFEGQPLAAWWLSWGLGSLWWPGFMVMIALAAAWIRHGGGINPASRPREVDPDRIDRRASAFGLLWFVIGAAFLICLPWTSRLLPGPLPEVFALDPEFLRERAPPVLLLWLGSLGNRAAVLRSGRWSAITRRVEMALNLAFLVLLVWWLVAGPIFRIGTTDDGAKAGIALIILIIVIALGSALRRQRMRIRVSQVGA